MPKEKLTRPCFIPAGLNFDELPETVRIAAKEIIDPAYRELVLLPRSALEKSTGLTIVHLLWIEAVEQHQLNRKLTKQLSQTQFGQLPSSGDDMLGHLRLLGAKDKACNFLLRLRKFIKKSRGDPLRTAVSQSAGDE